MLGMACHHCLWAAQMVERRPAWHDIISFGLAHTVETRLGVACHHHLWEAHTVERRQAWHAIIALGRQTRSNDVRRDVPSPLLDNTPDRTMSDVACHQRLWAAHTVDRRRAWPDITAFGQHTRSNDVRREMPSPLFDSTHGRRASSVAC